MLQAWVGAHPYLTELLIVTLLLAGAYLAARVLSWTIEALLTRRTATDPPSVERRLTLALRRPITYLMFLVGAWAAIHRAPMPLPWMVRIDNLLFALGVGLAALALIRAWSVSLDWYAKESAYGRSDRLAGEFGPLFTKLGHVFIALVALITMLQHVGVDVASLVVSLGVGSLALGLAAQDTLANMFAGFTLLVDRPFRAGDRIQLSTGEIGDVLLIGMRATHIKTFDETVLIVPNSVLVKDRVINLSQPTRGITARLEIPLAYGTDLDAAREIMLAAARECEAVEKEPAPFVLVTRFGELGVHAMLVIRVRDYTELALARSAVQDTVYRRLAEAGIEVPRLSYDAVAARRAKGGGA